MGAWIETLNEAFELLGEFESHPMWVRGLKQVIILSSMKKVLSHPMWVRGLKPLNG